MSSTDSEGPSEALLNLNALLSIKLGPLITSIAHKSGSSGPTVSMFDVPRRVGAYDLSNCKGGGGPARISSLIVTGLALSDFTELLDSKSQCF